MPFSEDEGDTMNDSADTGCPRPWRYIALLYIAATIYIVISYFFIFTTKSPQQLPEGILGEWRSNDPRYQNCFMTISTNSFIIGGADWNINSYGLKSFTEEALDNDKGRLYIVRYEDKNGLELESRIYYNAKAGVLSYKNQRDVIWRKIKKND